MTLLLLRVLQVLAASLPAVAKTPQLLVITAKIPPTRRKVASDRLVSSKSRYQDCLFINFPITLTHLSDMFMLQEGAVNESGGKRKKCSVHGEVESILKISVDPFIIISHALITQLT